MLDRTEHVHHAQHVAEVAAMTAMAANCGELQRMAANVFGKGKMVVVVVVNLLCVKGRMWL